MPSVPVSVRANKKLGTTHRSQWHLLTSNGGGGAGPLATFLWNLSRDSSKSQEPSPEEGIWSQAGRCRPAGLPPRQACFPICNKGCLNPDGEGPGWKDLIGQPSAPHAPLYEGASSPCCLL